MMWKSHLKLVLPFGVFLFGISLAWYFMATRPQLTIQTQKIDVPKVTVIQVAPQSIKLNVSSQGVVTSRNEIDLIPEVSGKIIKLHPDFVTGGFFEQGDLLVAIDARDYDVGIVVAQAQIAEAKRFLMMEQAQADQAKTEWQALGEGTPTELARRVPQLAEAQAKLKAAEASLLLARIKRSRCELRAPFAGRLQRKMIGLGEYIKPGDKLARLYSTDVAEVRLPLTNNQLGFLDLSLGTLREQDSAQTHWPIVRLSANLAGNVQSWEGRIVRTESSLDESTGQLYVVAEVQNPYNQKSSRFPLLSNLFVKAEIEGKVIQDVVALPKNAVNALHEVLLIDPENKLHIRRVDVLREEPERILIKSGLSVGDQLVISGIDVPVEGMAVSIENNLNPKKPQ